MPKSKPLRPYAWEKAAFLEDANEDSQITAATFRVLQKICAAFNRKGGYSECARKFIVDRVPINVKTVQRARRILLDEGRISIVRKHSGQSSTRFGVNWYFRGADKVREENGGMPIFDIRLVGNEGTLASAPTLVEGTFATTEMEPNVPSMARRVDIVSPKPFLPLKGKEKAIGASGALPLRAASGAMAAWRLVKIVATDLKLVKDDNYLLADLVGVPGGELHGKLTICLEASNKATQDEGQEQFGILRRVLGVSDIDAPEELHRIPFLYRPPQCLIPDPANEAAMENPDWYAIAAATGLDRRFRKLGDLDEIRVLLTPAMHKLAAKHEPMKEAA